MFGQIRKNFSQGAFNRAGQMPDIIRFFNSTKSRGFTKDEMMSAVDDAYSEPWSAKFTEDYFKDDGQDAMQKYFAKDVF